VNKLPQVNGTLNASKRSSPAYIAGAATRLKRTSIGIGSSSKPKKVGQSNLGEAEGASALRAVRDDNIG
jgi:hypothetical protein